MANIDYAHQLNSALEKLDQAGAEIDGLITAATAGGEVEALSDAFETSYPIIQQRIGKLVQLISAMNDLTQQR